MIVTVGHGLREYWREPHLTTTVPRYFLTRVSFLILNLGDEQWNIGYLAARASRFRP